MEFLIFPDSPAAAAAAAGHPGRVLPHASGRPWLAGHWRDDDLTVVAAGRRRLVVAGSARPDPGAAERALAAARSPGDLDRWWREQHGSAHLLVSFDGHVRAQGTLSGARQIFHTRVGGIECAGTGQRLLAGLRGAAVDPEAVALRLLSPAPPWPLSTRPVWRDVRALPVGAWLELNPDGGACTHRWWTPPHPDLPVAEAAPHIRSALCAAVAARARATVSADLSGGLDSTTLCFLADAAGADLITHHWTPRDPANADSVWAGRAARLLPRARHRRDASERRPAWFSEPAPGSVTPQAPLLFHRNLAQMAELSHGMRAEGSRVHLCGLGGDELFSHPPAHLWSMLRRDPVAALGAARRARLLNRWRAGDTVRALADRRTFGAALAAVSGALTGPAPDFAAPATGWIGPVRLPSWCRDGAAQAVRSAVTASGPVAPLHPDRVQHHATEMVTGSGDALRELNAALATAGLPWEAPFLDDRVVDAALRVRIEDRVVRGHYKPVLTAAVRGLVPETLLGRQTKGEFAAEMYEGLRANLSRLVRWCDDLRLADLGLVDAGVLRDALLAPRPHLSGLAPFEATLACESWLRSLGEPAEPGETDHIEGNLHDIRPVS